MRRGRPSSTARSIAMGRAWLDRAGIIDDPYAVRFLSPWRVRLVRLLRWRPLRRLVRRLFGYIAVRTRFYDTLVNQAFDQGIKQVVILAAGYDGRAWRLARPGVTFFEIDHPDTQAVKRQHAPGDGPTYVAADLAVTKLADALLPAGFSPREPAVFCCEGLTLYLVATSVRDLLRASADLAAMGSRLGVDFAVKSVSDTPRTRLLAAARQVLTRLDGEPIRFRLEPHDAAAFLGDGGWAADEILTGPQLHERFLTDRELHIRHPWELSFAASATVTTPP